MQFWRNPVLPTGVTFSEAESGLETSPDYGYCATYESVNKEFELCVFFLEIRPLHTTIYFEQHGLTQKAVIIDGLPGLLEYSPFGPFHSRYFSPSVWIFDTATGLVYHASSHHVNADREELIEIARSLLRGTQ